MIPTIQPISGQLGNIAVMNAVMQRVIIQVRNWVIDRMFLLADVTTTGSGGWGEDKSILRRWRGRADWPLDANLMATYEGVQFINGVYVPIGLGYPVAGLGTFQIGAAGTPLEPARRRPCSIPASSTWKRTKREIRRPAPSNSRSASRAPGPCSDP